MLDTILALMCLTPPWGQAPAGPWVRHTVDDASRGADGVRLGFANGDALPDVVTGWEEGGEVRVCLNPGAGFARERWPAVAVGEVASVEDAVFVDLDADGRQDVVSCCEGNARVMFVHWAPSDPAEYLSSGAWTTRPLPASDGLMQWMFCVPLQVDGQRGIDLIAGGKGPGAAIGWFESPTDPRDLAAWRWHPLCDAGWIMSLVLSDMDGDSDLDVLATDRYGDHRGCFWLGNPGPPAADSWPVHRMGLDDREVMFATLADLDTDGLQDVLVAAKPYELVALRRLDATGLRWERRTIPTPQTAGGPKAVAAGDIDLDGRLDIVYTCEGAMGEKPGCLWLSRRDAPTDRAWDAHDISGPEGTKYDLLELLDLDADGDLDVLTCEETDDLGVFWYENPTR